MHLLIIYPNINLEPAVSHGITALAGMLKAHGHSVSLLVLDKYKAIKEGQIYSQVSVINPDVIGLSLTSNQKRYAKEIITGLKRNFHIPIVVGGVYPTLFPEFIKEVEGIDGLCRGEGEEALIEYLDCLQQNKDYYRIKNWWFKKDGKIITNPIRPFNQNLDNYPLPDYEIFPKDFFHYPNMAFTRGCPFPCAYCSNHALKNIYSDNGPYLRFKSVARALEEIKIYIDKINPSWLGFDDDSITKNKEWLKEFCEKYPKVSSIPFHCNSFPSAINSEVCRMLKSAGCRVIGIGVESGDEEIRIKTLKRPIKNQDIIAAFKCAKDAGLLTHSFNMIGIPGETKECFKETVKLNRVIQPDYFQLTVFYPYEGTQLYEVVRQKGLSTNRDIDTFFCGESVLDMPGFSRSQIKWQYFCFGYNIYKKTNFRKALLCLKSNIKVYLPRIHRLYMKLRYKK
ncbi:MAG: B12-binding domain-containing radical SAM protein [Candidatus Omnitrophica bacterium]|nr:B12-binding domain-containing radical SAM protein [Candidatus Omnitrophota bacterium]